MSIKIGSEPDDYFKPVSDILNVINRNPIGAVLITRLQQHKNIVAIYPMDEATAAKIGADNAETTPLEREDSAPKGASERQQPYWYSGKPDNPATPSADERYDMVPQLVGTGLGTHAMIKFSPENIKRKGVYDRRPDTVLIHELVHALRIMQGQRNPIPTEEIKWTNEEEFLAVAITNVYLSAGGSTQLRGGYGDYDRKLAAPEDTSSGFLKTENLKLFDKLARFEGPMFTDLGFVVVARFNPFREWLRLRMA